MVLNDFVTRRNPNGRSDAVLVKQEIRGICWTDYKHVDMPLPDHEMVSISLQMELVQSTTGTATHHPVRWWGGHQRKRFHDKMLTNPSLNRLGKAIKDVRKLRGKRSQL